MNHSFNTDIAKDIGLIPAVMLEHLAFWILKNEANEQNCFEGQYWTFSSVEGFVKIFNYLTPKQIRSALDKLIETDYLVTGNFNKSTYDRTKWYALTAKASAFYGLSNCQLGQIHLPTKANGTTPKGQMDSTKRANGFDQKGEPIPDINTYITTDITTDISKKNIKKEKAQSGYSPEFEQAFSIYPKRPGANKQSAFKAWKARINAGASPDELIDGVMRYAHYVEAAGVNPQYIKQPATFFGPDEHYLSDWRRPEKTRQCATSEWLSKLNQSRDDYNNENIIDISTLAH